MGWSHFSREDHLGIKPPEFRAQSAPRCLGRVVCVLGSFALLSQHLESPPSPGAPCRGPWLSAAFPLEPRPPVPQEQLAGVWGRPRAGCLSLRGTDGGEVGPGGLESSRTPWKPSVPVGAGVKETLLPHAYRLPLLKIVARVALMETHEGHGQVGAEPLGVALWGLGLRPWGAGPS